MKAENDVKAYQIWECCFVNVGNFAKNYSKDDNDTILVTQIRNFAVFSAGFCVYIWESQIDIQEMYNDSFRLSS